MPTPPAWKRCPNVQPEVASWASRVFLLTLVRRWLSLDLNKPDHAWIKKIIVATLSWVAGERARSAEEHWLGESTWLLSESHLWQALGQDDEARACFDLMMRWFHSSKAAAEPERPTRVGVPKRPQRGTCGIRPHRGLGRFKGYAG